jgi:hypothetical protein
MKFASKRKTGKRAYYEDSYPAAEGEKLPLAVRCCGRNGRACCWRVASGIGLEKLGETTYLNFWT